MHPFVLLLIALLCSLSAAYVALPSTNLIGAVAKQASSTVLMACRRNNKLEKRLRNRVNARRFYKPGESRKKIVIEAKRAVIAGMEERFQAQLFTLTTDDDMPEYTGFDFI